LQDLGNEGRDKERKAEIGTNKKKDNDKDEHKDKD
jgi:hypothetical protein